MFHAMSSAEIDKQHVELLPTRILMSLMTQGSTPGQPGESSSEGSGDPFTGIMKMLNLTDITKSLGGQK